jgi:hypothetical protein
MPLSPTDLAIGCVAPESHSNTEESADLDIEITPVELQLEDTPAVAGIFPCR